MAASSSRSSSTMACKAVAVAESRRLSGTAVAPGGIFGLQGEQPFDRVVPALYAGAPVERPPIADNRRWLIGLAARAVASLAFGVAERVLTFVAATSGHGWISVT